MDYIEIGKMPPYSKSAMSSPEDLAKRLQGLVGIKLTLTGKSRTDGSNFRKLVTEHLLREFIPDPADEYEIIRYQLLFFSSAMKAATSGAWPYFSSNAFPRLILVF